MAAFGVNDSGGLLRGICDAVLSHRFGTGADPIPTNQPECPDLTPKTRIVINKSGPDLHPAAIEEAPNGLFFLVNSLGHHGYEVFPGHLAIA